MGSPFKMLPGSHSGSNKDRGMKQMAQRGLISGAPKAYPVGKSKSKSFEKDTDLGGGVSDTTTGGPKAYPLANNDPNSKKIEDWEMDVDLGGGTLDRQTKLKDVRPTTATGLQNPDGARTKGIFTQALIDSNMSKIDDSPEGGSTHSMALTNMNKRYDKYSNTGEFEMMTGGDSNNMDSMAAAGSTQSGQNAYDAGLADSPESSRKILSPRGDTRTDAKRDRANFLGRPHNVTGFSDFFSPSTSGIGESASSSEFAIGRKQGGISTADITSSSDIANKLEKAGTLDPEYRKKLEDYKKNN